MPAQFRAELLNRDVLWEIVAKAECVHNEDSDGEPWQQRVVITFRDGVALEHSLVAPKGARPGLSNKEIKGKWRALTEGVIRSERREGIEKLVLGLEEAPDIVSSVSCYWEGLPILLAMINRILATRYEAHYWARTSCIRVLSITSSSICLFVVSTYISVAVRFS
jgi:hypothetical protein